MRSYYSDECWPHNFLHEYSHNGPRGYYADYLDDPADMAELLLDFVDVALTSSRMHPRPYTYRSIVLMHFKEGMSCRAIGEQYNKTTGHISDSIKAVQRIARFAMHLSESKNRGKINLCDPTVVGLLMHGIYCEHKLATSNYTFLSTFLSHKEIEECVKCIQYNKHKVLRKSFETRGECDTPHTKLEEKRVTITIPRHAIPGYCVDGQWVAIRDIN